MPPIQKNGRGQLLQVVWCYSCQQLIVVGIRLHCLGFAPRPSTNLISLGFYIQPNMETLIGRMETKLYPLEPIDLD